MIKLTVHVTPHGAREIRVEGRLDSDAVRGLDEFIRDHEAATIDISGLVSVDRAGADFLSQLNRRGHSFRGGSLYLDRLLKEG